MHRLKYLLLGIVLVIAIVVAIASSEDFQRKYVYPFPYRNQVELYSQRYHVDISLIAGIIMTESKFDTKAQSEHGAIGLMQMMPETATWVASQMEDDDFQPEALRDATISIKYGTWYFAQLLEEYQGNQILAIAAYNAGRGNVNEWMEEYHWGYDFANYNEIPFPETREYVRKVLKNEAKYRQLYNLENN